MQLNPKTIKNLRLQQDWSQQTLADACDVSLRTIQRVEKEGAASKETTMSLCAVFEVSRGELIKLEEIQLNVSSQNSKSNKSTVVLTAIISFTLGVLSVLLITN
jgi:DNA-binding XRE family transcriptional regulator